MSDTCGGRLPFRCPRFPHHTLEHRPGHGTSASAVRGTRAARGTGDVPGLRAAAGDVHTVGIAGVDGDPADPALGAEQDTGRGEDLLVVLDPGALGDTRVRSQGAGQSCQPAAQGARRVGPGLRSDRQLLEPGEVLEPLLRSLGLAASEIPANHEAQGRLYRTLLAGPAPARPAGQRGFGGAGPPAAPGQPVLLRRRHQPQPARRSRGPGRGTHPAVGPPPAGRGPRAAERGTRRGPALRRTARGRRTDPAVRQSSAGAACGRRQAGGRSGPAPGRSGHRDVRGQPAGGAEAGR